MDFKHLTKDEEAGVGSVRILEPDHPEYTEYLALEEEFKGQKLKKLMVSSVKPRQL